MGTKLSTDRISGIVSTVISVLLFVLQVNGITQLNWMLSVFVYLILILIVMVTLLRWDSHLEVRWERWSVNVLVFVLLVALGARGTVSEFTREHKDKKANSLEPESSSTTVAPSTTLDFHEAQTEMFSVSMGRSVTVQLPWSLLRKSGAMPFGEIPLFLSADEAGRLHYRLTAVGNEVAAIEIKDGEFKVRPIDLDRNYSDNAFEVVDSMGQPILQLIKVRPDHLEITGVFPDPLGRGKFYLSESGYWLTASGRPAQFQLEPIFRYPSWRFPHAFVEDLKQK